MPTPTQLELAKQIKADRECARRDKFYLATEVLAYDFQADVHQELFDCFVQYDGSKSWVEQSEKVKRLILWPRGHYKSTAVVVDIIHAILNFPDVRILLMQYGLKNTKKLMKSILPHFTGDANGSRFKELFPEFCGTKRELECTPESFTVPCRTKKQLPQATVTCASAKSGKTGQHYDIAFIDDLICDQNYKSATQLAKAEEDFNMCLPLLDPPFYAVVTGTRYAHGDLYEKIIRADAQDRKWVISVKTCWTDDGKDIRFPRRQTRDGRIIGLTREELLDIRDKQPGMFASQYLNQPASTASELFTEPRLLEACIAEKDAPALSPAILFVDLASSQEERADDSVIFAGKVDHLGKQYVVDGRGGKWTTHQFANHVIDMAMKHRPIRVMFEKTASTKYFIAFLQIICRDKGIQLPIDYLKSDIQPDAKYIRISALDGMLRRKRLWFFANLPCWDKMVEQFTKFPGGKSQHDDYPDTVALLSKFFGENHGEVVPLSDTRNPFLEAIARQGVPDVANIVMEQYRPIEDEMGDGFSF